MAVAKVVFFAISKVPGQVNALPIPIGAGETAEDITIAAANTSGTGTTGSAVAGANQRGVSILAEAACRIKIGAVPEVTETTGWPMAEGERLWWTCEPGDKVSVVAV